MNQILSFLSSRRKLILAALVLALGSTAAVASEPRWPSKLITVIVPYSAGGATDVLARMFAEGLRAQLGQSVVVENKPGGGTIIASNYVMSSPADGYTLYVVASQLNQMPLVSPKTFTYDALKDFTPITQLASAPLVLVARSNFPGASLSDVTNYARANPGRVSVATTGQGATDELAAALVAHRAGIRFNYIPYKGGAPAIQDVAAGIVDLRVSPISSARPFLDSGRLKTIAVLGERSEIVPGVPAASDTYPGLSAVSLFGVVGPKGVPRHIVDTISRAAQQVMSTPDVKGKLAALGMEARASTAAEWTRLLQEDTELWRTLIENAKIKVE